MSARRGTASVPRARQEPPSAIAVIPPGRHPAGGYRIAVQAPPKLLHLGTGSGEHHRQSDHEDDRARAFLPCPDTNEVCDRDLSQSNISDRRSDDPVVRGFTVTTLENGPGHWSGASKSHGSGCRVDDQRAVSSAPEFSRLIGFEPAIVVQAKTLFQSAAIECRR